MFCSSSLVHGIVGKAVCALVCLWPENSSCNLGIENNPDKESQDNLFKNKDNHNYRSHVMNYFQYTKRIKEN